MSDTTVSYAEKLVTLEVELRQIHKNLIKTPILITNAIPPQSSS